MKQKKLDTLGLPDNLVPKRRFSTARPERALHFSSFITPKTVGLLVLIVLLLILAAVLPGYVKEHYGKVATRPGEKIAVTATKLPDGFPPDMPYVGSKNVLQNFNAGVQDKTGVGVRQWQVDVAPADILAAYTKYFQTFGWQITTTSDSAGSVLVAGIKDGKLLSASAKSNPNGKGALLEVAVRTAMAK